MLVYRISAEKYIRDLSGAGAKIYGGRWNPQGMGMVYTASSIALAALEVAVHMDLSILPKNFSIAAIQIPDDAKIKKLDIKLLPPDWNSYPYHPITLALGKEFLDEGKHLLLKVPSVAAQGDFNYLINPMHPSMDTIKIKTIDDFNFDSRLFQPKKHIPN